MKCAMVFVHDSGCFLCNGLNCIHCGGIAILRLCIGIDKVDKGKFLGDPAGENNDHTPPFPSSQLPTGKSASTMIHMV